MEIVLGIFLALEVAWCQSRFSSIISWLLYIHWFDWSAQTQDTNIFLLGWMLPLCPFPVPFGLGLVRGLRFCLRQTSTMCVYRKYGLWFWKLFTNFVIKIVQFFKTTFLCFLCIQNFNLKLKKYKIILKRDKHIYKYSVLRYKTNSC